MSVDAMTLDEYNLPETYAFSVCRIEPENNVHLILKAFSKLSVFPLVIVGNWNNSEYGRSLREQYTSYENVHLLDPIYDLGKLKALRMRASCYVHGHSAGGTNPSLVEAMHFSKAILAYDCNYNRSTTEDKALFFSVGEELQKLVVSLDKTVAEKVGRDMLEIANRRYTWRIVAEQYFVLCS
jgi:glycosyltransferase involved in cell wall biosynthesis